MGWFSKLKVAPTGPADESTETTAAEPDERPWWEQDITQDPKSKDGSSDDQIVVDDRAFLLGLDELYRFAMKRHERGELLACARRVAAALKTQPANVPIEGYYTEDADLTAYFQLMRALQAESADCAPQVEPLPEFQRLVAVTSSPIYGRPIADGLLLPRGRDPLSAALGQASPREWTVHGLMRAASVLAKESDDYSLVGLACRAEDSVAVAAQRESVVLYAEILIGSALSRTRPRYVWRVNPELAAAGQRFIDGFNELFGKELPPATEQYARIYAGSAASSRIEGRCVRLGQTDDVPPAYYHWAVTRVDEELIVDEFWAAEIWTTDRYRRDPAGIVRVM